MCYAKPGPRCAAHLATDIKKLETEIKELEKDSSDAAKFKIVQKRSRLDTYRFAYDGTQTGQAKLQAALNSMEFDDPDYKDIKKYKENARKEYDLKIRNFKEVEKIREEREAKKNDLLARKAKLEAELAALDSASDDDANLDLSDPDMDDSAPATPAGGTSSHSYDTKGRFTSGKGGSVASTPSRNLRSSPPIGSTTSYAFGGKGYGGK
jgi:hypothetical protein